MQRKESQFGQSERIGVEREKDELFRAECLVVPGHSIELVNVGGQKEWKPTRLIQEVNEKGWRTGKRNPELGVDSDNAIVGGGVAVTFAAVQYFSDLEKIGAMPSLVIFAAGRPPYLKEQAPDKPDLTEGGPMLEFFDKETSAVEKLGPGNVVILKENKNTQDDVEKSAELALSRGFSKVAFLLLSMRLDRAEALWGLVKSEKPELSGLEVRFLAAEDFLRERYEKHPERIANVLSAFESSEAYKRTEEAEKGGTAAARARKYKSKDY